MRQAPLEIRLNFSCFLPLCLQDDLEWGHRIFFALTSGWHCGCQQSVLHRYVLRVVVNSAAPACISTSRQKLAPFGADSIETIQ
jgi:hypothetical protein